jgi:hypothetical protein
MKNIYVIINKKKNWLKINIKKKKKKKKIKNKEKKKLKNGLIIVESFYELIISLDLFRILSREYSKWFVSRFEWWIKLKRKEIGEKWRKYLRFSNKLN